MTRWVETDSAFAVRYAGARAGQGHALAELAIDISDKPIRWGEFPSEMGTVTGPVNGLFVNTIWLRPPTDPTGEPAAKSNSGFTANIPRSAEAGKPIRGVVESRDSRTRCAMPTDDDSPAFPPDPVIEAYKKDVDLTLLRENLKLTVEERLQNLQRLAVAIDELHRAGRELRNEP